MLQISDDALRDGCDRARDLFLLNRLRTPEEALAGFDGVFSALGLNDDMRLRLQQTLLDLLPVRGVPLMESMAVASLQAGVLVGLLIADSTLPAEEMDLPVCP
jgi:hypothetical protein